MEKIYKKFEYILLKITHSNHITVRREFVLKKLLAIPFMFLFASALVACGTTDDAIEDGTDTNEVINEDVNDEGTNNLNTDDTNGTGNNNNTVGDDETVDTEDGMGTNNGTTDGTGGTNNSTGGTTNGTTGGTGGTTTNGAGTTGGTNGTTDINGEDDEE